MDYGDKRNHILNVAASMFAELGYAICRMEDIAERCGVSKSALSHYFKTKEVVLFEILNSHVPGLNDFIAAHLKSDKFATPEDFFREFVHTYLARAANSRERHAVTLKDTRYLTTEQLRVQEDLERRTVMLVMEVVRRVSPDMKPSEYKVYAFLLIGMLNWVELWFRGSGRMSRTELADRIARLFLGGIAGENAIDVKSLAFN